MCYASPGPRCEGHARERLKATAVKLDKNKKAMKAMEDEFEEYMDNNPEDTSSKKYKSLRTKTVAAQMKYVKTRKANRVARDEWDATTGGMDRLRTEIYRKAMDKTQDTSKERALLQERLAVGERVYNAKLHAYDMEKGTVDGRKPSPYGSTEGMAILEKRRQKYVAAYKNATTDEERDAIFAKDQANSEAMGHARLTFDRAKAGQADIYRSSLRGYEVKHKEATKVYETAKKNFDEIDAERLKRDHEIRDIHNTYRKKGLSPSKYPAAVKRELASKEEALKQFNKEKRTPASTAMHEAEREKKEWASLIYTAKQSDAAREASYRRGREAANSYGVGRYNGD